MRLPRTVLALALWLAVVMALPARASALPPIKNVFIIWLENKNYADTFGANSEAPHTSRRR